METPRFFASAPLRKAQLKFRLSGLLKWRVSRNLSTLFADEETGAPLPLFLELGP